MLYRIVLPYAVFGIVVRGGVIASAAPIGKWMLGKTYDRVRRWVLARGGSIQPVPTNGR